jgi:uncharacterized protein YjiS (DUF1127 family)
MQKIKNIRFTYQSDSFRLGAFAQPRGKPAFEQVWPMGRIRRSVMLLDAVVWRAIAPFLMWVVVAGRTSFRRVLQLWRSHRDIAFLQNLDDRMLRDMGLVRCDIEHAASLRWWRDPGPILVSRAGPRGNRHDKSAVECEATAIEAPSIVPVAPIKGDRARHVPAHPQD